MKNNRKTSETLRVRGKGSMKIIYHDNRVDAGGPGARTNLGEAINWWVNAHGLTVDTDCGYCLIVNLDKEERELLRDRLDEIIAGRQKDSTCGICGESISRSNKGNHLLQKHPELQVRMTSEGGTHYSSGYRLFHCGFCDYHTSSPGYIIKHIKDKHPELIANITAKGDKHNENS
jgi:hypothetical protein